MRQGNGGDMERSGDPHFSQRDERGQKLTAATACGSPNMEEAQGGWGGERSESGGEKLEVKITSL